MYVSPDESITKIEGNNTMVTPSNVSSDDTQVVEPDTGYHTLDRVNVKGAKEDYVHRLRDLSFGYNHDAKSYMVILPNNGRPVLSNKRFTTDLLTEIGGNGLVRYGRMLHSTGQLDLLLKNVHEQLDRSDKKMLIRTKQRTDIESVLPTFEARALLSTKYKRLDNDVLFPLIDRVLEQLDFKMKFLGGRNDGVITHARFISEEAVYEKGERKMYLGFQVRTSEVGASGLYIEFFICDAYCDNGMVFGRQDLELGEFYMKHLGRAVIGTGLKPQRQPHYEDIRNIQRHLFRMFQLDNIQMIRNMLELSFERTFDGDADDIIDKFGRHYSLSKEEIDLAKEEFKPHERHAYGIQAAFTAAAQRVETFDRRAELDRIGGRIVEQTEDQWNKLVLAA